MRRRILAALAAVTALTAASCGGSDSGMSTGDFRDALAEICSDTTDDVERLEEPDLEDLSTVEDFAVELREIVERTKGELDELEAPDDLSEDYDRFKGLVDDRIQAVEDLEQAAQDEDIDEIGEIGGRIEEITEDSREVADDLGVEECGEQGGDEPAPDDTASDDTASDDTATDDTGAASPTTAVVTAAPTTTAPPSTLPPVTLPAATAPPRTTPPTTAPATTVPPTAAPTTAPADATPEVLFDIIDLPARFNGFPPYTLGPPTAEGEANFIQIVASDLLLNIAIDEMGVGVIRDETGDAVATIVVGFAIDETIGMPNEWKNMICDPAVARLYTTEGGALGVYCDFYDDETNPIFEVFSATTTEVGLTIATLTPFVTLDELVDGFLGANT